MRKKRIGTLILSFIIVLVTMSSCGTQNNTAIKKDAKKYEAAVAQLQKTGLNEDGSYTVTEDLIVAIENAQFEEPKNIIYMIGDGMGANIIEASERFYDEKLYKNTLAMNYLSQVGTHSSYSASSQVTDSAAGGTALSTGYKTSNDIIAMNRGYTIDYKTVLELAAEKGKSTGIIATKSVTDATPASFTSHVYSRKEMVEIARQQLEKLANGSLDIVLGGGSSYYENTNNSNVLQDAKDGGMTYTTNWEEAKVADLPLVGLFSLDSMDTTDENMPTLAEMTDLALTQLSDDEDGFFLMVEGSKIDTYGHENNLVRQSQELYCFDQAIAIAMRYVALNPDTVLIITADHETGGLNIPNTYQNGDLKGSYTTSNHTYINVPVYACGYETQKLNVLKENTDIAIFIAELLGEDNFGQKSSLYTLFDGAKKEHRKVISKENTNVSKGKKCVQMSFTSENSKVQIPVEKLNFDFGEIKNMRALHVVLKNCSEEIVKAPKITFTAGEQKNTIVEPYTGIEPGETKLLTYVLPEQCWMDYSCSTLSNLTMSYNNTTDRSFELYSIFVTDRALED